MATQAITLTFPSAVNVSLQIGDTLYYAGANDTVIEIGLVTAIAIQANGTVVVTAQINVATVPPVNSSYIFFTKEAIGNTSNLKGYYAEAQFRNDKTTEVELFSVGSEIFESSK
tara:strand:+ start:601 stop:942 length:342 start_codon:yes stop_codon:yes gene_type:complete